MWGLDAQDGDVIWVAQGKNQVFNGAIQLLQQFSLLPQHAFGGVSRGLRAAQATRGQSSHVLICGLVH
jgi:hypothetical protein